MPKKILILMTAAMLGLLLPSLLWAGSVDATLHAKASSESKSIAPEADVLSSLASDEEGYLIGPGDVLDISVWKDEALTRSCVVRPDGFISFPLIGDVRASGRTASQIKADMEKKLDRYVPGATLSLEVKQVNSLIIYVIGKVNNPGRFILNVDANVLQALAIAGGLNIFANRNKIKILRHGSNETTIFPFEYDDVVEGKRLEQNIYLKRGDVVVIP